MMQNCEALAGNSCIFSAQILIDAIQFSKCLPGKSLREWDVILRLAKRANLIGRLAENVHHQGLMAEVPPQVGIHLRSARVLTTHQRQAISWEAGHIGKALKPIGVRVLLLKGAAYAMTDLTAARGRLFGDVDILVPRESLNQTEAALMMHGWISGQGDSYDEQYYRKWMHELPPMAHGKRGTVIDVHHNILPITARNTPLAHLLLQDSIPVVGTNFHVLSPVDMVIHSATHLFHEGELKNGLRDLFDLDALLCDFSKQQPDFWQNLLDRAKVLDLVWPLHLALRYTNKILNTYVPGFVFKSIDEVASIGNFSQNIFDFIYLKSLKPDHSLCNDFSVDISRLAIYIRSHYLKMPIGLLGVHLSRKIFMRTFKNTSRAS